MQRFLLLFICPFLLVSHLYAQNVFSVKGNKTYLNEKEFQAIGLRCSNAMICEGKKVAPEIPIAYNGIGYPPPCADLSVHFGFKTQQLPYIQTEGTPPQYWGEYSKEEGLDYYINVGMYTEGKKEKQLRATKELLDEGHGYLFASTWLQNVPPNYSVGGDGSPCNPGMKWWLDYIKENYK